MKNMFANELDSKTTTELADAMVDITNPVGVDVLVSSDRKRIWVNVNGICVLRCCQIQNLHVEED